MKENEVRLRFCPFDADRAARLRSAVSVLERLFVVLICPDLCWSFGQGNMT
jgi:hypothetical protein